MGKQAIKRKHAMKKLKEAEIRLHKVLLLPDNLLYVSIYQNLCSLAGIHKYDLCYAMATELIKELIRETD